MHRVWHYRYEMINGLANYNSLPYCSNESHSFDYGG